MPRRLDLPNTANPLTLADFAALVGAPPRWCQNALRSLGLRWHYDPTLARALGLARVLHDHHGVPLARALAVARRALKETPPALARLADPEGIAAVVVDVPRYLTQFALRTARLRWDTPRRRGRPRRVRTDGLAAGQAYGLDLGALRSGLRLSPADRLRRLDANQRLVADLRRGRRPE